MARPSRGSKRGNKRMSMRDKVRKRANEREKTGGGGIFNVDGVDFFQPKKGTAKFRILPYEITSENHPELPAGELWYQRTVWVHYGVGIESKSVICPLKTMKKKCPICEEWARLKKDPDVDEDELKALVPKEREIFNILPNGEDDPQLFTYSYHLFGKQLEEEIREGDEEWGSFAELEDGYMLNVRFTEKKIGNSNPFLEASRIDFKQDDDLDESYLDQVQDLDAILNVLPYNEIEKIFLAEDDPDDKQEEEPPEEKPRRGGRGSSRKPSGRGNSRKEKEEEEEPPKKKPRRGGRKPSKKENDIECPFGHKYAEDCNSHDDCDECDEWDTCQEAFDAL